MPEEINIFVRNVHVPNVLNVMYNNTYFDWIKAK